MDIKIQADSHAEPRDWKIAQKYYTDFNPNLTYSRLLLETNVDIDDEFRNLAMSLRLIRMSHLGSMEKTVKTRGRLS